LRLHQSCVQPGAPSLPLKKFDLPPNKRAEPEPPKRASARLPI
jgi:hypothetical protein